MSKKPPVDRPLPEEAFDRFVSAVDGPVNRVVERAMKSRVLLAPAGLYMSLSMRALKAMRGAATGAARSTTTTADAARAAAAAKDGGR